MMARKFESRFCFMVVEFWWQHGERSNKSEWNKKSFQNQWNSRFLSILWKKAFFLKQRVAFWWMWPSEKRTSKLKKRIFFPRFFCHFSRSVGLRKIWKELKIVPDWTPLFANITQILLCNFPFSAKVNFIGPIIFPRKSWSSFKRIH